MMMMMMMLLEEGVSWIPNQVQKDKKKRTQNFFSSMRSPTPPFLFMDDDAS